MLFRQTRIGLVVHAPAKLNLFLEILGKRPDGFHQLETLMVTVDLFDTLVFTEDATEDTIRLRVREASQCHGGAEDRDDVPADDRNLVVRAAELLRRHAGVTRGIRIDLWKRIPAAAGLAGGSSDAAATLAALDRWWNLGLSPSELAELASRLGSDVPFFLSGASAAVCRGRGELVEPLSLPLDWHFVVVRPRQGLSTASVYGRCRPSDRPKTVRPLIDGLRAGSLGRAARRLHNALQSPAEALSTEVTRLKSLFEQQPVLGHLMSGSGSAYFGVCAHRRQAAVVAARLRAARAGRVFAVRSRH